MDGASVAAVRRRLGLNEVHPPVGWTEGGAIRLVSKQICLTA